MKAGVASSCGRVQRMWYVSPTTARVKEAVSDAAMQRPQL